MTSDQKRSKPVSDRRRRPGVVAVIAAILGALCVGYVLIGMPLIALFALDRNKQMNSLGQEIVYSQMPKADVQTFLEARTAGEVTVRWYGDELVGSISVPGALLGHAVYLQVRFENGKAYAYRVYDSTAAL